MLTVAMVAGRVGNIYAERLDNEAAHSAEDKLHQDVLKAIANGECEDPAACAQQALMTQGIDFERWYA